jgi:hypothetical protein
MAQRPRSEDCKRLTLADVRPLVEPGAQVLVLADGTELGLSWGAVRGCFGGDRAGRALLLICPSCGHSARVLHRPPTRAWNCWSCTPVSRPSHRRPGARAGQPKPNNWKREQIAAEWRRCIDLLGLAGCEAALVLAGQFMPHDLLALPRRPGAPRISATRAKALADRLFALKVARWSLPEPRLQQAAADLEELKTFAAQQLQATAWAVRRPSGDQRRLLA